ncbi:hypothetical protein GCM10010112_24270 [Actinoplanes lobatus]|uniref:Phage baseplate protein n=1 Tax=Actinoplanes lobatus TaxID=113568 RepID=A0A7W7HJ37_9ACTN|nr:hypothetical protein [Actinoplanes lobatus]MBB4751469.1 hypothetical protein [Actinoplanes lobatus]GGN64258.1 hypothetical protein GCM10010112_24270 [Actinoplanes lobatus]GIE41078.1 hypothetical protein Alo02nite_39760 [Actinoplanes lobatus]
MTVHGSAGLLATWEDGLAHTGPARALALHRAARPGTATDDLLRLAVGERETDLYALRRALFGDRMPVLADCAHCGEILEFDLDAAALAQPPEPVDGPLRVAEDGWEVEFWPPTVADLAAAAESWDPRGELLARCVVTARHGTRVVTAAGLPETVQRRLAEAAERADPAGDIMLRVPCPGCGRATTIRLDIAAHLWAELDFWARDLLADVHVLAGAYGWTEPEILALSPVRRRYYLELCADA